MVDINTLGGPELVQLYNQLATQRGLPTVKRFASTAAGRKRYERLVGHITDVMTEFKTGTSKNRGKLLKELADHKGSQVNLPQLIKAVYGSINLQRRSALIMVLRGLQLSIKKDQLPYQIKKAKSETGVVSYGFYDKT